MPALSLGELARAADGTLVRGEPENMVSAFDIDTRRIGPGAVFFALPGRRSDGHAFLGDAARAGAAAAVVQQVPPEGEAAPPAVIRVESTERALGRCGALVRDKRRSMTAIAVTGSTGKTMTKELIAAGMSAGQRVHRTPGNWNNHLGLPLTLLACPDDAEVAVLELGMNHAGEIWELMRISRPDVALVTNVRPAHLENFRTLDDIAAAKGEMFAALDGACTSVVNLDDEHVRVQALRHAGPRVTYGRSARADLKMEQVEDRLLPGARFRYRDGSGSREVQLGQGGAHAAWNALAALAAITAAGGDAAAAIDVIAAVTPLPGRGRVHRLRDWIVLIDDSYNSSPAALATMLRTLGRAPAEGRRVLVVGDMLELGAGEAALHRDAARQAAASGVRLLFAVGRLAHVVAETARRAGVPEVHEHGSSEGAARDVPEFLRPGDLVLVKGSRSVHLERVVEALVQAKGEAA